MFGGGAFVMKNILLAMLAAIPGGLYLVGLPLDASIAIAAILTYFIAGIINVSKNLKNPSHAMFDINSIPKIQLNLVIAWLPSEFKKDWRRIGIVIRNTFGSVFITAMWALLIVTNYRISWIDKGCAFVGITLAFLMGIFALSLLLDVSINAAFPKSE